MTGIRTILGLVLVAGCACGAMAEPRGVLRTAMGEPLSLDPARARTTYEYAVIVQIFSRLVECDQSLAITPSLARSWTVSLDGRQYTFRLTEARFHNGREVTAADVVGSFERLLAPGVSGSYTELLSVIEGARAFGSGAAPNVSGLKATGPREVTVRLEEPYAPFLSLLSSASLSIVPVAEAAKAGERFGREPIGSGPFRLETWQAGQQIVLRAHDGAPEGPPRLAGIEVKLLPSNAVASEQVVALLQRGAVDYVSVPRGLRADPPAGYHIVAHPELTVFFIGFNVARGPAADLRLRRGMRLGLDRAAFARRMLADPDGVTDSMVPTGLAGALEVPPPDPEGARALFRELTHEGRRPSVRLDFSNTQPELRPAFDELHKHFLDLGLDVVLAPSQNMRELQERLEQGKAEAWFGGVQADFPDPDGLMRSLFRSRPRGTNTFGYVSAEVDGLLDRARAATDPAERARLYASVSAAVARDVPAIPLWTRRHEFFVAERVRGLAPSFNPFQVSLARVWLEGK
jgi:peptide/nickel transport system substrate-binding protein/oligopeptide transport system substrate-binding protein